MVTIRGNVGVEGGRRDNEGKMAMEGDLTGVVNIQYNTQMMHYRIAHLKPI